MKNIGRIIAVAKPLYHLLAIIAVLIVLGAIVDLIAPILSKFMVDEIVLKIQNKGGDVGRLALLIGVSFAMNLLGIVFSGSSDRIGDHFSGRFRKLLTEKFYDKVLTLPQTYFDSELSGKIVNQLARGITSIQGFINAASIFIVPMFLQSVFTIAVMFYFNIPTALLTFLLFPTYLFLSYYSAKKWGEQEEKKNKFEDVSRGRIQEVIANIKVVKTFNNEKNEYNFLSKTLEQINIYFAKQSNYYHLFDFARNLSLVLILLGINIVVFYSTFQGIMSLGTMVLLLQLLNQARRPLFAMSFILTNIQNAESGSKEFFEILDLPSKENYQIALPKEKIKSPEIKFKNVSFKYQTSEMVLKNVTFNITDKQSIALVGPSGTGKTTVVNLILKFYEATEGNIYLNGKSYKDLTSQFIRNNIALVFQENELFSTTIKENVAYGNTASDEEIIKSIKLANAYDFVKKLPQGINTEVGERGIKLSGGQKQRVQIARAILKDAPILILDEATSNLDAKSELEVQKGLENLMKNRLVIIIAHRFSTIQNVNNVIVLDEGRVVDSGTPQELSSRPGIYSDLLRYQIEGNKKLLEKFEIY